MAKICSCVFFWVIPCGGEKHINKMTRKSRDNPVNILCVCVWTSARQSPSLCVCVLSAFVTPKTGAQKFSTNFICTRFLEKPFGSWTSTPPVDREKPFDPPKHPGIRVRNIRGKSGPEKFMFMLGVFQRGFLRGWGKSL